MYYTYEGGNFMALKGHGYIGRCRFKYRINSTGQQPGKVTKRKMTEEEMKKYGVKPEDIKSNQNKNDLVYE